jgi:hypothetical protein
MTKRINTRAMRVCLFSGLTALLMGCNDQKDASKSTFPDTDPPIVDNTTVPPKPVVGIVTEVPDTKPKPPVTTGGEAIPLPPDHVDAMPPTANDEALFPGGPVPSRPETGNPNPDHDLKFVSDDDRQGPVVEEPDLLKDHDDIRTHPDHVDAMPPTANDEALFPGGPVPSRPETGNLNPDHDLKFLSDDDRQGPVVEEPDLLKDHDDIRIRAGRFTEIAPDTIGGDTFQPSPAYEYNLGNLVAITSSDSKTFSGSSPLITPIKGWVRYPEKALASPAEKDRFPVILFLHGQHAARDPSYKGYDYLAESLARHGYVVFSIDGNEINGDADGDRSSQSRAQLVLATLDVLRDIDDFGQIGRDGKPGALDPLKGKIDLSRIGIMGHSRGGQGIANAILFNKTRRGVTGADLKAKLLSSPTSFGSRFPGLVEAVIPAVKATPAVEATQTTPAKPAIDAKPASIDETKFREALDEYNIFYASGNDNRMVPRYAFKGAFMLAPTDFGAAAGLKNVPLANLLPSCDGDVASLDGALVYDHNRYGPQDDAAPRYQILVQGTNHNDYNTIWTSDDFAKDDGPDNCLRSATRKDSIRLSAENQRRNGLFTIASFMRYHVGGEQKFEAYWNGTARLPGAACPSGNGPCDERVILTVQKQSAKVINRFDKPDALTVSSLGGSVTLAGFDNDGLAVCAMGLGDRSVAGSCSPKRLPGFEYRRNSRGLLSTAEHAELSWSKPGASIAMDLKDLSIKGYDSLTFRIAVVQPMGQEVLVTLTDSADIDGYGEQFHQCTLQCAEAKSRGRASQG